MTILVDMDDVLEQLVAGWVVYLNRKFGTSVRKEDVKDWNMAKAFPGLSYDEVYCPELDDDFWLEVDPMPGADETLRKLIAEGHEIYIVTATLYQTLRSKMENVLFKYFPYIDWDHVIITSNKQMIKGDVLVDDGPHNFMGGDYYKILFDANHNRNFDEKSVGAIRVMNWEEAYREIHRYAESLAQKE